MATPLLTKLKRGLPKPDDREGLQRVADSAKVSIHTLRKIVTGETSDPKLSTVEPLLRYLEREAA